MINEKLNVLSLSEQVYQYLREQINMGVFLPGSTINMGKIANQLGVSKTPLRDALIQLEVEGFVTILPRRGVRVNMLELQDVKNAYGIIGALEAAVITQCFDKIDQACIQKMEDLNDKMINDISRNDFSTHFESNLAFHEVYLDLSDNEPLRKFILPIKQRLYEFPRKIYITEWEMRNCKEHAQFINYIKKGDREGAARILKDVHWSFDVQEPYITQFHEMMTEEIDVQMRTAI